VTTTRHPVRLVSVTREVEAGTDPLDRIAAEGFAADGFAWSRAGLRLVASGVVARLAPAEALRLA